MFSPLAGWSFPGSVGRAWPLRALLSGPGLSGSGKTGQASPAVGRRAIPGLGEEEGPYP